MDPDYSDLTDWQRRSLLKVLGPAALGVTAGCIGDDSEAPDDVLVGDEADIDDIDVPDDDDDVDVGGLVDPRDYTIEGQTLRLPGSHNPQETYLGPPEWLEGDTLHSETLDPDYEALDATNEMTVWGRWPQGAFWEDPGEFVPLLYEDVVVTEELMSLTIRDDAYWHDGEPITARDGLLTISTYGYTPDAAGDLYYGSQLREARAPDGLDGKEIELEVLPVWLEESDGWLHHQPGFLVNFYLGPYSRCGGVRNGAPAHKWPYNEIFEQVWEYETTKYEIMEEHPELWDDAATMRQHREEHEYDETLFDTWWRDNMPEEDQSERRGEGAVPRMTEIFEDLIDYDEDTHIEVLEQTTDPDWYVGHGLYELNEVVGTEGYSLVPNENHRLYDEHTFDEVFIEWTEEDHRLQAGIMAEHLDYGQITMGPETTAELPDSVSQITFPDPTGFVVSLNHAYWPGDSVWVRQALMHATDRENIAENIHPDAAGAIMTPGLDNWGAGEYMDIDWAEENLTRYEYDLDRATELMERAGYERIDDVWHDADGNPVEDIIATTEDAPIFEETLSNQWQDFGLDTSTQTFDETTFSDRWEGQRDPEEPIDGDFALSNSGSPSSTLAGWLPDIGNTIVSGITFLHNFRARHWYGKEATEEISAEEYRPDGYGRDFGWEYLTIELPPAGEPESDERIPYAMSWANQRAQRDVFDFTGDNQPVEEGLYEPNRMNVSNIYEANAWALNWYLFDLPMVRNSGQQFVNTENFLWGEDIPQVDGIETNVDAIQDLWEWFGSIGGPFYYPSSNLVWGNPQSPDDDGEVRES